MRPSFNIAGPCIPGEHYMLPPERRLGRVRELINDNKYFTLHAGRQTGKTTSLMWLERHLNNTGQRRVLWVDIEAAREQPDPARALQTILGQIDDTCRRIHPSVERPSQVEFEGLLEDPATALRRYLTQLSFEGGLPWVMVSWKSDRHAIELKIRRDTETEEDALEQIAGYLEHAGLPEGWLVMFDLRKGLTWQEKLFVRSETYRGKQIRIVGC